MATTATAQRLSPKVRRLLHEHDLDARAVAGTGAGGRVTPHDVLGAAGVPRRPGGDSVLASPLARRLLRDAGVDLAAAARANDQRRMTRSDAERLIAELSADPGPGDRAAPPRTGSRTEVSTDVGRLLAALAAADGGFLAHNGFELTLETAVASAVAAVLVRRPELVGSPPVPRPDGAGTQPSIHIGFVPPRADHSTVVVVPDAQYLTVSGLARRARAAAGSDEQAATASTIVVASDTAAPQGSDTPGGLGLLTVGSPAPRRVSGVDELGHELVRTRPHTTLRLHHGQQVPDETAAAFLDELAAAVAAWSLPVGP